MEHVYVGLVYHGVVVIVVVFEEKVISSGIWDVEIVFLVCEAVQTYVCGSHYGGEHDQVGDRPMEVCVHAVLQLLTLRPIFLQLERSAIDVSILPSESFGTAGNFSLGNVHQWKSKGESVEENDWYTDVPQAGNDDRLRKHLEESIGEEQGEKRNPSAPWLASGRDTR